MLRFFSSPKLRELPAPQKIILGELEAELVRKHIRNVHLSVHPPDGRVRFSAPLRMPIEAIRAFGLSKLEWIKKQQIRVRKQKFEPPLEYLDGESHLVWGRRYVLNVETGRRPSRVELSGDRMVLRVPSQSSRKKRKAVIDAWYGMEVLKAAPPLVAKWEPVMDVKVGRLFTRRMKTRWGSCNIATHAIRLNSELAKKSPECLEYIVVHEMVHLLERRHNARFKRFMDRFLPKWKSIKKALNQMPVDKDDGVVG